FARIGVLRDLGKEGLVAQIATAAEEEHLHAGGAAFDGTADNVEVAALALDILSLGDLAQADDLVAVAGGALEIEGLRGLLHALHQVVNHLGAAPFQEHLRMAYVT